ncbi:MAG: glycosyltransferase family 4 protein [Bacteroidota bacterium]
MKALIITYYWPPAGGSGVQRWLKFVKYLQDFGIDPVVYTVDNPKYIFIDDSLEDEIPKNIEILKQPIWEPNNLLSLIKSKQKETSAGFLNSNPSFFEKQLQYIRANYFIPDSRKYWIKPSVDFLSNYLQHNDIDVIITTGPPHSLHLIGLLLKQKFSLKWIADFRDPWTDIDYFHQLPLTKKSKKKHHKLEAKVLKNADAVLVVGKTMQEKYQTFNKNTIVISNGFDGEINTDIDNLDDKFSISHIGMMNADRNPKMFWKVLTNLIKEDSEFSTDLQVNLIGKVAPEILREIISLSLKNHVNLIDYLPHNKVLQFQRKSQVLLLAVNKVPSAKGIVTGKIFEYLQANRPILAIAPQDGDLAEIIKKTNSGFVIEFGDEENLKEIILNLYKKYKERNLITETQNIAQYHRKNLTEKLVEVIRSIN